MMDAAPGPLAPGLPEHLSTIEVARMLGMAVRSVQLMVDRGALEAWKTPGGHRRITRQSVERWLVSRAGNGAAAAAPNPTGPTPSAVPLRVLLIEDDKDHQALVAQLVRRQLPQAEIHTADDGISGLALAGRLEPDLLLVDMMLPGIVGATLIASLRSHPMFQRTRVAVVTGLGPEQLARYEGVLTRVPVVRKARLAEELPAVLAPLVNATSGRGA
jgi:excisionase family DNA binding protein